METLATLAPLFANVVVVAILAALGVADLYRARQARRFRVVVYPVRQAMPRRRYTVPARGTLCTPSFATPTGRRMAAPTFFELQAIIARNSDACPAYRPR